LKLDIIPEAPILSDCACVVGWHFRPEVFTCLSSIPRLTVFLLSHKPSTSVPPALVDLLGPERIFCMPNEGYDWGAFQQFLELGLHVNFRNIFFMHDDIQICDTGFRDACNELLDRGHAMVGNGRAGSRSNWLKRAYPAVYSHSDWMPANDQFQHATVRGSFFGMTTAAVRRLGKFEVFWDRFGATPNFGNWSLVSSCGRAEAILGGKGITWLSDDYLKSRYIIEGKRGILAGEDKNTSTSPNFRHRSRSACFATYRRIADTYVRLRLRHSALAPILAPLVHFPGKRRFPPMDIPSDSVPPGNKTNQAAPEDTALHRSAYRP